MQLEIQQSRVTAEEIARKYFSPGSQDSTTEQEGGIEHDIDGEKQKVSIILVCYIMQLPFVRITCYQLVCAFAQLYTVIESVHLNQTHPPLEMNTGWYHV